jgi:hypothetical protein
MLAHVVDFLGEFYWWCELAPLSPLMFLMFLFICTRMVHFLACLCPVYNMDIAGGYVLKFINRTQITAVLPHRLQLFPQHSDVVHP